MCATAPQVAQQTFHKSDIERLELLLLPGCGGGGCSSGGTCGPAAALVAQLLGARTSYSTIELASKAASSFSPCRGGHGDASTPQPTSWQSSRYLKRSSANYNTCFNSCASAVSRHARWVTVSLRLEVLDGRVIICEPFSRLLPTMLAHCPCSLILRSPGPWQSQTLQEHPGSVHRGGCAAHCAA